MPLRFWGDKGAELYFNAYFARFDNVWVQGNFIMTHQNTRSVICLGRSDGVLNPSGIRFGFSEIYGVLEAQFSDKAGRQSMCRTTLTSG